MKIKKLKKYFVIDLFIYHIRGTFFQSFILMVFTGGVEFIVWQNGNIDFLLVDLKLTALSFFLLGSFVLQYVDSSNQRLFSSRFTRSTNMSNQISRICMTTKNLCNKSKLFFFNAPSLFLYASVSMVYLNEESNDGTVPEAMLRLLGG